MTEKTDVLWHGEAVKPLELDETGRWVTVRCKNASHTACIDELENFDPSSVPQVDAPVQLVGLDGYDQKAVDVIKNLSMLVRRLAHKHPNTKLAKQAFDYLYGEGLQGSVLR